MRGGTIAHIAIIGANLIYGFNYFIAKIALPEFVKPAGFIFIRVSIAFALFWLVHRFWVKEKVAKKDLGLLALCGFFGVALNQTMFFQGLARTGGINASLIMITTPILVLSLSALLSKERITKRKVIGIILGSAGAAFLISFGESLSFGSETFWGDLFIFINACSYAVYLVIVKPMMKKYQPLTVIKWVFGFGFMFVALLGWSEFREVSWSTLPMKAWLSIGYVVILTTFLAYFLNIFALSKVNPSVVSVYIYAQPLIATLVSVLAGHESLTQLKIICGGLIFVGVYFVSVGGKGLNKALVKEKIEDPS